MLWRCNLLQPKAQFYLINTSKDKPRVDIKVYLAGDTVFADTIKYSNVAPDLQYMPSITASKGKHLIIIEADRDSLLLKQPLILDKDKWIFITYFYEAPIDSATLIKKYGFIDPYAAKKLKGRKPELGINVQDTPPNHL
jgi:hypothetical protein